MKRIDINADMGESFGRWKLGADEELIQHVSSANIACGFHAGDWEVMAHIVQLATKHHVAIGAHPSYPDLQGFGRRHIDMAPAHLTNLILYQLGALWAIARAAGTDMTHVKPHGALYNDAMRDPEIADGVALGIKSFSGDMAVFCLPNSCLQTAAIEYGLQTCAEGFADRLYEPSGLLVDRHIDGSVLNSEAATRQSLSLASGTTAARGGTTISLVVDTLCIHGDSPEASTTARAVRQALEEHGYLIAPPGANV